MLFIDNRIDTDETATSVLEHESHVAGTNEVIAEEDDGTETDVSAAAAASAGVTSVTQSADSDAVLDELQGNFLH